MTSCNKDGTASENARGGGSAYTHPELYVPTMTGFMRPSGRETERRAFAASAIETFRAFMSGCDSGDGCRDWLGE
jgi:hypothetical protein